MNACSRFYCEDFQIHAVPQKCDLEIVNHNLKKKKSYFPFLLTKAEWATV